MHAIMPASYNISGVILSPLFSTEKGKKKPDRSSSMDGLKKRMRERRLRRTGCVIIQASAVPSKVLKCAPFDNVCTWRVEV